MQKSIDTFTHSNDYSGWEISILAVKKEKGNNERAILESRAFDLNIRTPHIKFLAFQIAAYEFF